MIVLDTNVLLNLYRLPTTARDELIGVLDLLKDRLWIPHQVALEFQRRRLTVIGSERKMIEGALTATSELMGDIKQKVDALQIDKRGLGIDPLPLLTQLERANDQLVEAIRTTHEAQLDISAADPIRDRLDTLLENRVGEGPSSQEDLDSLVATGEDRFKEKVPPGFADADKDKNPNEATFIFDQIKYQRKFGDLILWKQLIQHVHSANIKTVILVTSDRKDDWWWREQGKTIGPHPELVREILREGGVDLFWMYSSDQFVEHANKYSSAKVSTESVEEIKQVAFSNYGLINGEQEYFDSARQNYIVQRGARMPNRFDEWRMDPRLVENCVERWLQRRGEHFEVNNRGFPDFLVQENNEVHGYEVRQMRQVERVLFSPSVVNNLLRGYMETREGRLSRFTLVISVPEDEFFDILNTGQLLELRRRLGRLLKKYPIDTIVVGAVLNDEFHVLVDQMEPMDDDPEFY